jgi:hypothetical protein
MSTPAMTRRLANVCRRQCQLKFAIFASLSTGSNQRRGSLAPPADVFRRREPLAESFERLDCRLIQRDMPHSAILAPPDREHAQRKRDILPEQPVLFAQAESSVKGEIKFRHTLRRNRLDCLAKRFLFIGGQKPNPSIVFKPMRHESSRILLHLAVANGEPIGERKQCTVTIGRCGCPFLPEVDAQVG